MRRRGAARHTRTAGSRTHSEGEAKTRHDGRARNERHRRRPTHRRSTPTLAAREALSTAPHGRRRRDDARNAQRGVVTRIRQRRPRNDAGSSRRRCDQRLATVVARDADHGPSPAAREALSTAPHGRRSWEDVQHEPRKQQKCSTRWACGGPRTRDRDGRTERTTERKRASERQRRASRREGGTMRRTRWWTVPPTAEAL